MPNKVLSALASESNVKQRLISYLFETGLRNQVLRDCYIDTGTWHSVRKESKARKGRRRITVTMGAGCFIAGLRCRKANILSHKGECTRYRMPSVRFVDVE
jgi:hypothetical protein